MALSPGTFRELALFAGAGGGGSHPLGWERIETTALAQSELPKAQQMEPVNCTSLELSTYLQALGEGYLATSSLDITPSALSRSTPIASKSYPLGNKMVSFPGFPSLAMSKSLMVNPGEDWLTWYRAGFRASRFHWQVSEKLNGTSAISGPIPYGWLEKSDPNSVSLKMSQDSLLLDISAPSSVTFPQAGMLYGGAVYRQPKWELTIGESDSGYLPTPSATSYGSNRGGAAGRTGKIRHSLETMARSNLWPTPIVNDATADGTEAALRRWDKWRTMHRSVAAKLWPTPTVNDATGSQYAYSRGDHSKKVLKLGGAVKQWPTPTANRRSGLQSHGENALLGQLNPQWVEWLMGWPLNWTCLKPLCKIDFILWRSLNGVSEETTSNKKLSQLWWRNDPATVEQWQIRLNIQEQKILFKRMQQFVSSQNSFTKTGGGTEEGAEIIPDDAMSEMWSCESPEASSGQKSGEQFPQEYNFLMSKMPRCEACTRRELGKEKETSSEVVPCLWTIICPTESERPLMQEQVLFSRMGQAVSRVTMGQKFRVDRIAALGDGQVPRVVAAAWRLLTGVE